MKQTIDKGDFRDAFDRMGRGDQFSYEALGMIYDYLTALEDNSGHECELDVIGICCEFTEYATAAELREAFRHLDLPPQNNDDDDDDKALLDFIDDHVGAVLVGDGGSPIIVNG
jgi:hypothetical protein